MRYKVLFLTLRVFSATGGIEKVCRVAGKALYESGLQYGFKSRVFSLYCQRNNADKTEYFPQQLFRGFGGRRSSFLLNSLRAGRNSDVVLMSHINLLIIGQFLKFIYPKQRLVLLAHGIEVWDKLPAWKRRVLERCDLVLAVSAYTRSRMLEMHGLDPEKIKVLNNCLDPYLEKPLDSSRNPELMERYGLQPGQQILLTVARMADTEVYKGYDKVIEAMPALLIDYPNLRYLLVGKYGPLEKQRLDALIGQLGLQDHIIFAGFVPDEELAGHFNLADIFIMPSEKEGFGIVFIEAMFYGVPVIAGNVDGSVDALANGELGLLVDPRDITAVSEAISKILDNPDAYKPNRHKLMEYFGYEGYKRKLHECLGGVRN